MQTSLSPGTLFFWGSSSDLSDWLVSSSEAAAVLPCIKAQREHPGQNSRQDGEYSTIDSRIIVVSVVNVKTLWSHPPCSLGQSCDLPEWELNEPSSVVGTGSCFSRYSAGRWSALPWYGQVCPEGGPETLASAKLLLRSTDWRPHYGANIDLI